MKIAVIGSRGYPRSYASAEDIVREFGRRFVEDGDEFTVHGWATEETIRAGIREEVRDGIRCVHHRTPGGKISGQFVVALKSSLAAAFSDCDLVFYIFVNSGIFCWIPRLAGKRVVVNVDGIMWRDPKWPWGIRHVFFPLASYLSIFVANKAVTDSVHMQELYRRKFRVRIGWIGYGSPDSVPTRHDIDLCSQYPQGYYAIMSRITPHNLTDIMVDGFIRSGTRSHLVVAGHTPDTEWFHQMVERAKGHNVTFLGLVRDQQYLTQILLNAKAYLHGHSLGGINPALVRVTGMDKPAICVNTVFNREVVEYPNRKLQARLFEKNPESVAEAIRHFERDEEAMVAEAIELGKRIRSTMSWTHIYHQYRALFKSCF
jgi:glycosyltransferase involved in cell wall biosynthesis